MYNTLRTFAQDREQGRTRSSFMERFRFFSTETKRKECIRLLEKWSERLYVLAMQTQGWNPRPSLRRTLPSDIFDRPWNSLVLNIKSPSARIHPLTKDLYTALSNSWSCSCADDHEARFCLNLHATEKSFSDVEAEFSFLVQSAPAVNQTWCWKEGTVGVRSASSPLGGDQLIQVCEALSTCMTQFRLRLLMEDISGQHHLWKPEPRPRGLPVLESEPPRSLCDLLCGNAKIGAVEKRELAVICAYSLLLLHDTPWLNNGWNKTNLSFFFKLDHEPDFVRPYISTRFETPARQIGSTASGVFHRNSNILALGILLMEIFNEKPIERWRKSGENAMVSPDTEATFNLLVALRIVGKMDNCPSTAAIKACLQLDWVPQGQRVSLDDHETRNGFFDNVIRPLEAEVAMVARTL